MSNNFDVTDIGIASLAAGCRKLEKILISDCRKITDTGLVALASGCPRIQSLTVKSCCRVSDVGITAFALKCRHLNELVLDSIRISDTTLTALARNSRKLQTVTFIYCPRITYFGLSTLAAECVQIQSIFLGNCRYAKNGKLSFLRKKYSYALSRKEAALEKNRFKYVIAALRYYFSCT
jgi:Leucine Rich repeat